MDRPAARAALIASPVLAGLAGTAALFLYGKDGWTGAPNDCLARGDCYCETIRAGLIHQPANTWSAVAFVVVATAVALHAAGRAPSTDGSLMRRSRFYQGKYAVLLSLIGPGTMALHATHTRWGGALDTISMFFLGAFMLAYAAYRLRWTAEGAIVPVFAALSAPLAAAKWIGAARTEPVFGALIALAGAAELKLAAAAGRKPYWLYSAFGLFAAAFLLWLGSHTGGPLCVPDSLLQGHAAWHVLTALAGGALYLHYWHE